VKASAPLLAILLLACCGGDRPDREPHSQVPSSSSSDGSEAAKAATDREWFTDRAHDTGLDFRHFDGVSG